MSGAAYRVGPCTKSLVSVLAKWSFGNRAANAGPIIFLHAASPTGIAPSVLEKIQRKEVAQGFTFPLTIDCLMQLKGATVIPMGVHDQWSINEAGERIVKPRAYDDASFPTPSGYSVNLDHESELLEPCIYGQCLRRVLHDIHKKRLSHPSVE